MVFSELGIEVVLAGLAGGMLGAALGGLTAFTLAGIVITVGEIVGATVRSSTVDDAVEVFGVDAAPLDAVGLTGALGFGPPLGPHVAFAGGVAAAAYLGRRETFDTTFRYHQAKNIRKPLGSAPDVLLIGGVFGVLGVLVARVAAGAGAPVDPIALAIVVSGLVHRLVLGYPVVGRVRGLEHSILDMTPFEEDDRWGESGYETSQGIAGRQVAEVWLPDHYQWGNVAGLGIAVGLASGYIALVSGSPFLAFGLAAASLAFLAGGLYSVPVVYHIALPAGIAALAVDPEPVPALSDPVVGLLAAAALGLFAALVGELAQRTLYAHGDTHLDPAAVALVVASLVVTLLATAGVFEPDAVPYPVL